MRKKKFILALQPHEANHYVAWSPRRTALSFCLCLALMGLVFSMTTPDQWQERMRVGLLTYAYGWQTSPLISPTEATAWYSDIFSKTPKTGCSNAPERDWKLICPVISSQMANGIDCDNAGPGKMEILKNIRTSKTTYQYQCLYG